MHHYKVVYNLGIPGESTSTLIKRLPQEATSRIIYRKQRDIYKIFVQLGTNDAKALEKPTNYTCSSVFQTNLELLLEQSKNFVPKNNIIFISPPPVDEVKTREIPSVYFSNQRISEYANYIKKKCEENRIHYIDIFTPLSQDQLYPF